MKQKAITLILIITLLANSATCASAAVTKGANNMTITSDQTNLDDTMNLLNLSANSGVPLGGIGTGCFDFAPDGHFKNIKLNNTENNYITTSNNGFLFALYNSVDGAVRLQKDSNTLFGMKGFANSVYTGLYPKADVSFYNQKNEQRAISAEISAFSPVIAQNVKDSSLPVAYFDVTLNNTSNNSLEASLAFSFEDLIARGLKDPEDLSDITKNMLILNGTQWPNVTGVNTTAEITSFGSFKGVHQKTESIPHIKDTHQNYNTDVTILADTITYDQNGNAAGNAAINTVLAYNPDNVENTWQNFCSNGTISDSKENSDLSSSASRAKASVICAITTVKANSSVTVRFMVNWYAKETQKKEDTKATFGTGDYNKYYHNYFSDISSLNRYCSERHDEFLSGINEWQTPILKSTMPDWLKFKQINSAYVLTTNSILNKSGSFTLMEGGMNGLCGTSDQRLSSHPFYEKLFSQLNQSENNMFGISFGSEGNIMHFTGNYYAGIIDTNESKQSIPGNNWMIDNSMSWLIQMVKEYQNTGDIELLTKYTYIIQRIYNFLQNQIKESDGLLLQIPQGPTTYDDRTHPAVMSYSGSVYLAALNAFKIYAEATGNTEMLESCRSQITLTQNSMNSEYMYNGKYYAYGYGTEETFTGRVDYVFTGMLAGQFLSRYSGWGDILPYENIVSSIKTQLSTSVLKADNYYAPKVWDDVNEVSKDILNSFCWPFYLESYTAMLAIQEGFVRDGLTVIKSIQDVHMELGYTWCISLWNPNNCTYMTSPVTWFINDVLTGAAVDLPNKTLTIGPADLGGEMSIPLYYPDFWGVFNYNKTRGTASLKITKVFNDSENSINKIIVSPNGLSSDESTEFTINSFNITEGNTLTFSTEMINKMNLSITQESILPEGDGIIGYQTGDVNGDAKITAADALLALQHSVKKITLEGSALRAAQTDANEDVSASDALLILQKAVNKINKFPEK